MITLRSKLKPLSGKTLVESLPPPDMSPGGIYIPERHRDRSTEFLARGINGKEEFVIGDRLVASGRIQGMKLDLHRRKLRLVQSRDVLAVFI